MTNAYDIEALSRGLEQQQTKLIYFPQTKSTMDDALQQGLTKSLVLTDHQTAGRGRYSRQWEDDVEQSILATYVRLIPRQVVPKKGSLLLSHLFVLAVQQAISSHQVAIRWPNDLTIADQKLGGVLLNEGEQSASHQAILFGVGINVFRNLHYDETQRASLDTVIGQPDRAALVLAINRLLDSYLLDLPRFKEPEVYSHYNSLWQKASALIGREIEISNYGASFDKTISGTVSDSPLGRPLQLTLADGGILVVKEYGHTAHIEVHIL